MIKENSNSYDIVPYQSRPFPSTHPDRLCAIGRIFGMSPAHPTDCRVLELGCASGGNLVPMAEQLQNSTFVGVDLSGIQIADGQTMIDALRLPNLSLLNSNILDVGKDFGMFDYVICHGVYSWVESEVQNKILSICRDLLRPHGIGFVSFNTYPGWHMRENVRRMMQYHSSRFSDIDERVRESRSLLAFVSEELEKSQAPHAPLLKTELNLLNGIEDFYLFHEHLEDHNTPCYFHEFASRLREKGLKYLGDADVTTMLGTGLPSTSLETIHRIASDIIQAEQYMDFIRNRQFRMALVCKETIPLKRTLDVDSLTGLRLALRPGSEQPVVDASQIEQVFHTYTGKTIRTDNPILKTALKQIIQTWPESIEIDDLYKTIEKSGLSLQEKEKRKLAIDLLWVIMYGSMTIHSWDPPLIPNHGTKPKLRPSSILTARRSGFVTNARHERVVLNELIVQLSQFLDGKNDRNAIVSKMVALAKNNALKITVSDKEAATDLEILAGIEKVIDNTLISFNENLLFVED